MWLQNNIFLEAIVLLVPLLPIMFWPLFGSFVGQKFLSRAMLFGQVLVLLACSVLVYRCGLGGLVIDFSGVVFKFSYYALIVQLFVALLASVTLFFSFGYMNRDSSPGRFYSLLIPTQSTLFLFIGADNNLLSWGGLFSYTLLSGLLMAYYYSDLDKVQRAVRSFIVEGIGLVALLALCLLPAEPAHGRFAAWLFVIFIVCQCSQFPCHVWGGEVAAAPSPATALMQGGYSIIVALLSWFRFLPLVDFSKVELVLMAVAVLTMICGATYGLLQWNIKRLFSYITINRLGFLLLLFSLGSVQVSLLGLAAFLAAVMFSLYLGAAIIIRYLGDRQQLEMMGALYKKQPLLMVFFFFCFYFIMPLPFSPFLLGAGKVWHDLLIVSSPSWCRYLLLALYLLAEFAQACLLCRFWCRVFIKKPVMDVTAAPSSGLPVTMIGSYLFSVLLAVLPVVCFWLDNLVIFPVSWWLLFLPLLGWGVVSIYMHSTKTHYFPGHYRALRHEQFLNDLSFRLLVRPLMLFSEVLLKRFIGQWCIRVIQTIIAVAMRIGGYVLMWLHRGDLRYYLAIFFIGMVIVAVSAGVI